MSKRTNEDLLREIIDHVGGADNIQAATNCMTRMRMRIKDDSKVDHAKLEQIEGVMGVVDADTLQVVVGPGTAKKVTDLLKENYNIPEASDSSNVSGNVNNWQENKQDVKDSQHKGSGKRGLETIANIFIPMIPAIIAAGLFQ